jgi:hypothetical protein
MILLLDYSSSIPTSSFRRRASSKTIVSDSVHTWKSVLHRESCERFYTRQEGLLRQTSAEQRPFE